MWRTLRQLWDLKEKYNVDILCAGDIFHRWNSPPELINFALVNLPPMIAISGQHDQPYHNYDELHKSAFWTLVKAGVVEMVGNKPLIKGQLCIYGAHFGQEFPKAHRNNEDLLHVLLAHRYVWMGSSKHPKAKPEEKATCVCTTGHDLYVLGDNHKGFYSKDISAYNCGALMRRRSDEADYLPHVGLLHADGDVEIIYLDTDGESIEQDVNESEESSPTGLKELLTELNGLQDVGLDFEEALKRISQNKSSQVRSLLLEALNNGQSE